MIKSWFWFSSDWTNQKPVNVLRNLKRGNEWYNIKKGTATPLNRVIAQGGLKAQLNFWRQRMEGADIADIYYNAFLVNGKPEQKYSDFEAGQKVRLRIINGSASSQFWLTFGGEDPLLVAADGLDVMPVKHDKTFIAIAETYDFVVTIPQNGSIELRAMAQDGSGFSAAYIGNGSILPAQKLPRPDKIDMMKKMAKMDMRMGAPAMKFNPANETPKQFMNNWGMQMNYGSGHDMKDMKSTQGEKMNHDEMALHEGHGMKNTKGKEMQKDSMASYKRHDMKAMQPNKKTDGQMMNHDGMFAQYNYDYLMSPQKTDFAEDLPVKEVLLNLTGNMWRYIWSMNGVPLSEADQIKVNKGEVVRITLNNLTMMHHPMHLHGHFFRVINEHGDYSPLKHTVNVAPMQKTVIEFDAKDTGDWFFHCHVLYHMMSGMARIYSYEDYDRDPRLRNSPLKVLTNEGNRFYSWGMADLASHLTEINLVSSNTRNQFNLTAEYGWNKNMEAEISYERYLYDYFRVFAGVNAENEMPESLDDIETVAIAGIRFLTPYLFNLDVRIDHKLRPEVRISREVMIFPRTAIFGNYEYQADFGWDGTQPMGENGRKKTFKGETTWSAGAEYFLSRNFSIMASYDNRFGAGGGLSARF